MEWKWDQCSLLIDLVFRQKETSLPCRTKRKVVPRKPKAAQENEKKAAFNKIKGLVAAQFLKAKAGIMKTSSEGIERVCKRKTNVRIILPKRSKVVPRLSSSAARPPSLGSGNKYCWCYFHEPHLKRKMHKRDVRNQVRKKLQSLHRG